MKSHLWGTALLGVALLVGPAQASLVTINFDDLAQNEFVSNGSVSPVLVVSNQYFAADGVTFCVSDSGPTCPVNPPFVALVESGTSYHTSSTPNIITTGMPNGNLQSGSTINLILTFQTPVFNLGFDAFGNDAVSPGSEWAMADVYQNGSSTPTTTTSLLTCLNGVNCATPEFNGGTSNDNGTFGDHETLAGPNITKVVIRNDANVAGTAFDNFSFNLPDPPPTAPEPSTLFLTGLCGIVWAGRRFLARKRV